MEFWITHEHSDHINGLGVFSESTRYQFMRLRERIAGIKESSSLGKMPEGLLHPIKTDHPFQLGELDVHPFAISHDAKNPSGYRIEQGGKSVAVATDLGKY